MTIHVITQAFRDGADAFRDGKALDSNPYGPVDKAQKHISTDWDNPTIAELAYQWDRGFRNMRKHSRFNATIAARKA